MRNIFEIHSGQLLLTVLAFDLIYNEAFCLIICGDFIFNLKIINGHSKLTEVPKKPHEINTK